jgi:uncharacterized RDD family membrane protein YckC
VASLGDRIIAHLVDRIIQVIYIVVVVAIFINTDLDAVWPVVVFVVIPWFCFNLAFEIFMNGQSPGKRLMNIQVVRLDGTQPGVGDYLLRWVFGFIDFYIMLGALAVIVIAANGKGQRLGDLVAGTSVVKLIAHHQVTASTVFVTPEDSYIPVFPQVVQLEGRDIELIQRALDARHNFNNLQPVLLVTEKVKTLLGIQTNLSPEQFLQTVVKDFNHLTAR